MIYEFKGYRPVVHESAYVHPQAVVTGNVIIGRDVYIGPGAAIRGDWGEVLIEDGCNVQENCTIHMFPGTQVRLHSSAHVGHGAIIHGATLLENCLIGMNAVIMDNAVIGKNSVVGALAFVADGVHIPDNSIAVGNPARVVKEMSEERIAWKTEGTRLYQSLPKDLHQTLRQCEPLREVPADRPSITAQYARWKKST